VSTVSVGFDQIAAVREQCAQLAEAIAAKKQQRAATHQIGDADCRLILINMEIAEIQDDALSEPPPTGTAQLARRVGLLRQKYDGVKRLAEAHIVELDLQIQTLEQQRGALVRFVEEAGRLVQVPGGRS
jgi:hypothetical protein